MLVLTYRLYEAPMARVQARAWSPEDSQRRKRTNMVRFSGRCVQFKSVAIFEVDRGPQHVNPHRLGPGQLLAFAIDDCNGQVVGAAKDVGK